MQNLLLLGGTLEARRIAADLAGDDGFAATLSLAGVTSSPPDPVLRFFRILPIMHR